MNSMEYSNPFASLIGFVFTMLMKINLMKRFNENWQ